MHTAPPAPTFVVTAFATVDLGAKLMFDVFGRDVPHGYTVRGTTTEAPRRRDIQRHRSRSGRHTTTTRNRQLSRHTGAAHAEFGELAVDRCRRVDLGGNERSGESENQSESRGEADSAGASAGIVNVDRSLSMSFIWAWDPRAQPLLRQTR